MSGWHLFSNMGVLGGDILALVSVIGSVLVFLGSIIPNSDLRRLGKFLDMSVVCLIMGTIGQFAIAYTGTQVDRVGFLRIRILIVDSLLVLALLFLLASWFICRNRPQLMRVWRNCYPAIWRGVKHVNKYVSGIIALGTKYRDKDLVSIANQFHVYDQLVWWYDRWKFRRHLSWLGEDRVSLGYLLEFEQELKKKAFLSFRITEILEEMLKRYHKEQQDNRLPSPIPPERLPDMLQVMIVFYSKNGRLHRSYRGLIISILQAEDEVKAHPKTGFGIPAEQFRIEATKAISNLNPDWGKGNQAAAKNVADHWLRYLTNIAKKVTNLQMFKLFQSEAAKIGGWYPGEKQRCLENIADKVSDLQTFTVIFQDIVPVIGLETTSSLLGITQDFQEFEVYFRRINEQLKEWGPTFISLFVRAKDTSELDRLFIFLGALAKHKRMANYIHYTEVHQSGTLLKYISGALPTYKGQVFQACLNYDWKSEPKYERWMDDLIAQFEQNIVHTYLWAIWYSFIQSRRIRWEFSRFTEYIPSGISSWDWTKDTDKTRPYWNSGEAQQLENNRYSEILGPLLLSIFRQLGFSEIEALFDLLPQFFGIEEFKRTVKVPVEWEKRIEYQEAYDKWAGFYTQEVEVARPTHFVDHTFTFERPYMQNAINLLQHKDKIREAIQAYKKPRK